MAALTIPTPPVRTIIIHGAPTKQERYSDSFMQNQVDVFRVTDLPFTGEQLRRMKHRAFYDDHASKLDAPKLLLDVAA